jgi:hypothetical protein
MTRVPVGGVIWQTLHYLVGLERLGFEVYYTEDHGMHPNMFCTERDPDGTRSAAEFIHRTLEPYGFGARWSYHVWWGEDGYRGMSEGNVRRAYANASACDQPERRHTAAAGAPLIRSVHLSRD